ncbi:SAC3/GANP/Nin1/mts3/eIF-3 p25 family-domain-containing protein [Xylariaceae sp. FL0804]|nr:SAC3/GANP/Nin1/mts3/eIF-3 p25 family-domain-containing protein [Xylariaceae sp. FL0804]
MAKGEGEPATAPCGGSWSSDHPIGRQGRGPAGSGSVSQLFSIPFVSLSACCNCCCLPWPSSAPKPAEPPTQTSSASTQTDARPPQLLRHRDSPPSSSPSPEEESADPADPADPAKTVPGPAASPSQSQRLPRAAALASNPESEADRGKATTTTTTTTTTITTAMAERSLQQTLQQLRSSPNLPFPEASSLLSKAKLSLLQLGAATPSAGASPQHLTLAREVYEAGALASIRARNPDAFTRYVAQLQPFYEQASSSSSSSSVDPEQRNRITGLYLLLLLTQGRYGEFHSELESLAAREASGGSPDAIERDRYLGYPVRLERWLMEGSYDRVWKAMKSREVPSEEYGVFSEILTSQIRSEIASSSERAYPSLPLSSTKSLLFLDSEGAVVDFARERGWLVRDGHIYFPSSAATISGDDTSAADGDEQQQEISRMVIENTLGYARELETIV